MAKFIIASNKKNSATIIKAESIERALDIGVKLFLISEHDKKYGNIGAISKPKTSDEWEELERKLIVSTGEAREYGYFPSEALNILHFVKEYNKNAKNNTT